MTKPYFYAIINMWEEKGCETMGIQKIVVKSDVWKVVTQIKETDNYRQALKNIYIENNTLYSTNGRVAIRVMSGNVVAKIEVEDGTYRVLTTTIEQGFTTVEIDKVDEQYPTIGRLYDAVKKVEQVEVISANLSIKNKQELQGVYTSIIAKSALKAEGKFCLGLEVIEKLKGLDYTIWICPEYNNQFVATDTDIKLLLMPRKIVLKKERE